MILTILPFTLALSTLLFKKRSFAMFAFLGGVVSMYCYLGLGADGDITYAATNVIASAGSSTNTWVALIAVPGILAVSDYLIAVGRAFKMI